MQNQIMCDIVNAHNSDDGANQTEFWRTDSDTVEVSDDPERSYLRLFCNVDMVSGQHNVVVTSFNTSINLMFLCCKLYIRIVGS